MARKVRNLTLEFKTFQMDDGRNYLGVRYPRKGQQGKYHYRFFVQIAARKAVAELKGYSSTEQVEWNDYEKLWAEG